MKTYIQNGHILRVTTPLAAQRRNDIVQNIG